SNSMMVSSPSVLVQAQKRRPQREDQSQALDERQPAEQHEEDRIEQRDAPAELMAGDTADHDQQEQRNIQTQRPQQQAEHDHGTDDDEQDLEVELVYFGFGGFGGKRTQGDCRAQYGQDDAQPEGEIAGAHAG